MENDGVVIGAVIALVGTLITSLATNFFMIKTTKLNNENRFRELKLEISRKSEADNKKNEHDILMNNREFITKSIQNMSKCMNILYNTTERLVANYPGTPYTGTHPDLLFKNTISNLSAGFPISIDELNRLDEEWGKAYKNFDDALIENRIFLSKDVNDRFIEFQKNCYNIKTYFYGRFAGVNSDIDLEKYRVEYNNQVQEQVFLSSEGLGSPTKKVLDLYDKLNDSRTKVVSSIQEYEQKKTKFSL
ncbi:hypothetical protein [Enterococcus caccae]|uniref:Uncharacterized protein n=1 Tax=Enterococcus caccae ATCC BAA-1240 TaxID=1158612 RepID=R3WRA3_9ENTE|nr:hypothetical protein [Enterococcus caccae]EOL50376.1 hypothetical protein UC7_00369 [Enterococcus caccae ATCC BAA-1240]EOT59187.1 hypothetical protein I580_02219 [Enterococcus caccae ATCC BAA-1240]OJG25719.1 hypothetical protein RU98_GL000960 [Enterococcus caccae]